MPDTTAPAGGGPARRIVMLKASSVPRGPLNGAAELLGAPTGSLSMRPYRIVLAGGAVLILIALLANSAGVALTLLSAIVPILLLFTLAGNRGNLLGDESIALAISALGGVIVGGVLGWIGARLVASTWFDEGILNFGAAGFGGQYAHAAGNAGWLVWLLIGIVLPLVAIAAALALPFALHRSGRFQEVSANGTHLGAAAGAGFAVGAAAVFWSPLNVHDAPGFAVSDWTLMVLGVALLQPIVAVLAFAASGTAIWRFVRDQQIIAALLPAACGLGGMLLLRLGSLWIQPRQEHLWLELIWTLLLAVAVGALYHLTVVRSARRA